MTALIARGDLVVEGYLYAAQKKIHPQSVTGTLRRLKWFLAWLAQGTFYLLPFARWDRGASLPHQAVLIDFDRARFYFLNSWPAQNNGGPDREGAPGRAHACPELALAELAERFRAGATIH